MSGSKIINSQDDGRFNLILSLLFLFSVFLLALNKIQDWDAWIHLSMGRAIFEQRGIPRYEPYVFTLQGQEFGYGSWLFGLIYYMAYRAFTVYGVILLKAFTITTAFYILFRDSLRPHRDYITTTVIMTVVILVSRHRFVERPDTFLMVFLSFSIFSLNAFIYDNKKYLYALPFIHILWVNSHTSVSLMAVPFLSFIGGGILQLLINRFYSRGRSGEMFPYTPSIFQLITITLIFIVSLAATLITPQFSIQQSIGQHISGIQFMGVDWFKQEISELRPPTWDRYKSPYILSGLVLLSFVVNWVFFFLRGKDRGASGKGLAFPSLIHLFIVLPVIYLSFTAIRFIFLLAVITGPVLARNLSALFAGGKKPEPSLLKKFAGTGVALWLVLLTTLTIARVQPFVLREQVSGFGINYDYVPEAALSYMDKKNISGRIFNLYHWGQYITWRDFPKRAPFVDGRGHTSLELLEKMGLAPANPSVLNELYTRYGFESILIGYPVLDEELAEALSGVDAAVSSPDWALVYWDDQSLIYLKRGGKYDAVIRKDEYRFVKPANSYHSFGSKLYDERSSDQIVGELRRNISETGSSVAYALLGYLYNETGSYKEALDSFSKVRETPELTPLLMSYTGRAYAYGKLFESDRSIEYFKKSLQYKKDPTTLYSIGIAYLSKGEKKTAAKYLEEALELNKNLTSAYPMLVNTYKELGRTGDAAKMMKKYDEARVFSEGEESFKKGVAAYVAGMRDVAAVEFKKSIEANPSNPVAHSNLGYVYFDMNMLDKAYEHQKKSIDIDPNYSNAHYGLALIYKKWGNTAMAKEQWKEYLRIEPSGYYSRVAEEEIHAIERNQ